MEQALKDIETLFKQAENKIKNLEEISSQGVLIPSINQLRYAGYHIVRAVNNKETSTEELSSVIRHIKRAIYDADEAIVIFYLESIKEFKENYLTNSFTTSVLPNYIEILANTEQANQEIQLNKENNYNSREEYYKGCEPHIQKLAKYVLQLNQAIPVIAVKTQEREEQKKQEDRKFITNIGFSVLAILITVVIGVVAI